MWNAPRLRQGSFLLGLVAFSRGSLAQAAHHLDRALDLDPSYADALGYLAMTYFYAGRMTDARATADRLVAVDPFVFVNVGVRRRHGMGRREAGGRRRGK
jgi:Tfp pilus assembly protein PilF